MTLTMDEIPGGARLITNPNMVLREEEEETAFLFNPDTGAIHILNATSVAIWKLLDGERDLPQIMRDLREQFDELDVAAEAQVVELLNDLLAIGAIGVLAESWT